MDEDVKKLHESWIKTPFFAATKQKNERSLEFKNEHWTIGVPSPFPEQPHAPALDIRHGRVLFTLLSFRNPEKELEIQFTKNEFCRRYAGHRGGQSSKEIFKLLGEIERSWVQNESIENGVKKRKTFRLLENTIIDERINVSDGKPTQMELFQENVSVRISKRFFELLQDWESMAQIRLDVLQKIRSKIAQTIYTYIPSRAFHHSEKNPFKITLTNLLEQIGHNVPPNKSSRLKIFTQNKNPVIKQLDGLKLLDGRKLRASISETNDHSDYILNAWVEMPRKKINIRGKLYEAWIFAGKTEAQYHERISKSVKLDFGDEELIIRAGAEIDGNEKFFESAAALLGIEKFRNVIATAKTDAIEGDKGKNPTGRLIYRLIESIKR